VIGNVRRILAVEYVVAGRAIDLRRPLEPAPGTGAILGLLRERVDGPGPDRYLSPDLLATEALLTSDALTVALRGTGIDLA
jgi:histidine ammonia-lyase